MEECNFDFIMWAVNTKQNMPKNRSMLFILVNVNNNNNNNNNNSNNNKRKLKL